jgi:hypothetical protein
MRPAETVPGMGGGEIKEDDGGDEFNYDIYIVRTFVNVTMCPWYNHMIKKNKNK